ncbi:hypothetical protein PsAD26_03380 [Pseudovibrio sp. Ad26]|nr:hypothetical protein PsAD26_03380 [Pseudovibrio sp. Ad26]
MPMFHIVRDHVGISINVVLEFGCGPLEDFDTIITGFNLF